MYTLFLIGGEDDETAEVVTETQDEICRITFRYRDRILTAEADDYFESLCSIRSQLEGEGLIPFCYGASLNVFPSGMSRSMGEGQSAYRLTHGRQALSSDLVCVFDAGHDVIPSSVANQREYFNSWIKSLKG